MGKKNKLRETRRRDAARNVCAVLQAHSRRSAPPRAADFYSDISPGWRRKIEAYSAFALRAPSDWRCRLKSRSEEKRLLDLVKYTFARYRMPAHLENVWSDDCDDDFADDMRALALRPHRDGARPDLCRWYLIAAQGGSLYKQAAHPYMTKAEAHHFLNAPAEITAVRRAFWYAYARAQTDKPQVALRVAQTKLY